MKVVINACFGGFSVSDAAYEKFIEWGVPVRKYIEQERDPDTGLYLPEPRNEGEIIFDRELTLPGENAMADLYWRYKSVQQRYWEGWLAGQRSHPLLLRVIEELGAGANGPHARLKVIDVPDDAEWSISEYDGSEHIAEAHRTWA